MTKSKEEPQLTQAETMAKIFMEEGAKIKEPGVTTKIIDATKTEALGFRVPAEKRKEFYRTMVIHLGDDPETIELIKGKFDDLTISLGGEVGYLLDTGEIEVNPGATPLEPDSNELISKTVYTFGVSQENVFKEEEALELDFQDLL